tara:strand:- start:4348 stop:5679 length:1332 start_codon:yes stop_codon:yes gene_type:complete
MFNNTTTHDKHKKEVEHITGALKQGSPLFRTHKNTVSHSTRNHKDVKTFDGTYIDITPLHNIIELNKDEKWILVEPLVTMEELVSYTLPYGYIPYVVPEFKHITVGGAIQGLGAESPSNAYGFFHEKGNTLGYEVILGNGDIVWIENGGALYEDLQEAIPGSYGTIGIITLAKIKLQKVPPFIELSYHKTDLQTFLDKKEDTSPAFRDSVLTNKKEMVVMDGVFTNTIPFHKKRYRPFFFSPWFDQHILSKKGGEKEYFKIKDYLFRWDRGTFFIASTSVQMNGLLKRCRANNSANSYELYKLRRSLPRDTERIVQDFIIPYKNIQRFISLLYQECPLGERPLWLLPMSITQDTLFGPKKGTWINIGFYHISPAKTCKEFIFINKALENLVTGCGGYKWLYADNFYEEKVFWEIYDREKYRKVRKKYGSDKIFENIFKKVISY